VNDAAGNRLSGIPVTFSTDAGLLSATSATSDANGEARTALSTTAKARVTASVAGGSSSSLTASVDIPVRVGPTVTISTPATSIVPGVPATFSVSVTAGGAAVRSASIDFGDGGKQSVSTAGLSSVTHVYTESGTFIVTAEAIDTAGDDDGDGVGERPDGCGHGEHDRDAFDYHDDNPAEFAATARRFRPALRLSATVEFRRRQHRTTSATTSHLHARPAGPAHRHRARHDDWCIRERPARDRGPVAAAPCGSSCAVATAAMRWSPCW
jgi:hypothetical protein